MGTSVLAKKANLSIKMRKRMEQAHLLLVQIIQTVIILEERFFQNENSDESLLDNIYIR